MSRVWSENRNLSWDIFTQSSGSTDTGKNCTTSAAKDALTADITALEENLETIKADLKAKKAELKKLDTELSKLEEQKAEADAKAAEEAQRAELEETIQKLMATGVTAAEILEKLK